MFGYKKFDTKLFLPDPTSMRPITIKIARAINFPKAKDSLMRAAHLTLAQFINMVRAKTKIMRKIRVFSL